MLTAFFSLFDTSRFPARWLCGEWSPGLGWLHIGSDLAIWTAYFSIPALLLTLARRRRDLPFRRVFLLFGAFILLCGTTHLIEAVIFWWPIYPVAAAVKFATAVASWGTVVTLAPVVRDALTLRSPAQLEAEVAARTSELERANERLAADAAEHRRTLDSLHRTEERLRLALEAGEMGAWEWDLRDNRVEWTPGLDAMHGLAPGAFGGTLDSFVALVHEDDRPQLESDLEVALREGTQFTTEFRTRRIDGTEGWVTGIGRAHYEADGRPVRMVGVGLDVTTRRQAEEAARFLADAGRVLGDIVDVESTLQRLATLAVPRFADYCAVSLLDPNGELRRVPLDGGAMTVEAAWAGFEASYPEIVADSAANVVRTGVAEFVPVISRELIETRVADTASAETPASLGLRSYLTVPLKARGKVLGSLTFVTAGSGRYLTADDVRLAEQLAERASTAVENARLYEALRERRPPQGSVSGRARARASQPARPACLGRRPARAIGDDAARPAAGRRGAGAAGRAPHTADRRPARRGADQRGQVHAEAGTHHAGQPDRARAGAGRASGDRRRPDHRDRCGWRGLRDRRRCLARGPGRRQPARQRGEVQPSGLP